MTTFIYILGGEGGRTGMYMYFMTALYCNYLDMIMIKAQFLICQHFLGFNIKKLKTSCQETPTPANVK